MMMPTRRYSAGPSNTEDQTLDLDPAGTTIEAMARLAILALGEEEVGCLPMTRPGAAAKSAAAPAGILAGLSCKVAVEDTGPGPDSWKPSGPAAGSTATEAWPTLSTA
jgi:hypothetical protein